MSRIVFFDGHCSICNFWVDWLMRIDGSHQLQFASLQGETARLRLKNLSSLTERDSVIYDRDGTLFDRSTAILRMLADTHTPWSLLRVFLLIPRPLRDFVYKILARNRYRFFKRRETCRIPTSEEKSRLLP